MNRHSKPNSEPASAITLDARKMFDEMGVTPNIERTRWVDRSGLEESKEPVEGHLFIRLGYTTSNSLD